MMGDDDFNSDYFSEISGIPKADAEPAASVQPKVEGVDDKPTDVTSADKPVQDKSQVSDDPNKPDGKPKAPEGQDDKSKQAPKADDKSQVTVQRDGTRVDKAGNLYNENNQIIARAGTERRLYETLGRTRSRLQETETNLNVATTQLAEVQLLNNVAKDMGLSHDEIAQSIDIASRIKRGDAIGAAKEVVAMLVAKGHKVSDLFEGNVGDAIETRALRSMLDEALAPIRQQTQQAEQETEQQRQGRQNYERFIDDNEYAEVHGEQIVTLANKTGISMQAAYNQLREYAVKNQLDFSIPLRDQVIARRAQQDDGEIELDLGRKPAPRPMVNGGTHTSDVSVVAKTQADPDDDWGTIVKRAIAASKAN